jgi:hypothetical protein
MVLRGVFLLVAGSCDTLGPDNTAANAPRPGQTEGPDRLTLVTL